MKNFFSKLLGSTSTTQQRPQTTPFQYLIFMPAMANYQAHDPQPGTHHFIQAFAFALASHTTWISENLLLSHDIPDWERIGEAKAIEPIQSFGSYFGLRLAHLTCEEMKEREDQDDVGKRMISDMWFVTSVMFGQNEPAKIAYESCNEMEDRMSSGAEDFNSTKLINHQIRALDYLLGLQEEQDPVEMLTAALTKGSHIAGNIGTARTEMFNTIDEYMGR